MLERLAREVKSSMRADYVNINSVKPHRLRTERTGRFLCSDKDTREMRLLSPTTLVSSLMLHELCISAQFIMKRARAAVHPLNH
jgi:hypothetical protein